MGEVKRIALFGAGGLGRSMAKTLSYKTEMKLVAMCDKQGFAFNADGIDLDALEALAPGDTVAHLVSIGQESSDSMGDLLARRDQIDGIFLALPNLPNDFIPGVVTRIAASGFQGVVVDALKRTSAMEMVMALHEDFRRAGAVYIAGAGCTPGMLTAATVIAAQSFVEVDDVTINFGVGIANWESYRATIREDIAHLDGFSVESVAAMTDAEIEAELEKRNGILELVDMEHADDIMLELAGVVGRDKVHVGGIVDTRNARKPVSTSVKISGTTVDGLRSTHTFTLGDETTMAANVNGPVLGYMKTGFWLKEMGVSGVFTSADLLPRFPR